MKRIYFIIFTIFIAGISFSNNIWASSFKSRVKIEFEKAPKIKLKEKTKIKINFKALDDIQNFDMNINLPAKVTLHSGKKDHKKGSMSKGNKYKHVIEISIDDSTMSRISVEVRSKKNELSGLDHADLYLISYEGEVELLDQKEVCDQRYRYWKTSQGEDTYTIPISYEDTFIQLGPGEEIIPDSINFEFNPGKPFVTINRDEGGGSNRTLLRQGDGSTINSIINTTVYGRVRFKDSDGLLHDLANATVEVWEDDSPYDEYLGSTTTSSSGYFSKSVSGSDLDDDIEIFLQVVTKNSKVEVYEPSSGGFYRYVTSSPVQTSGRSINFRNIDIDFAGNGAFSIFHWMNESWNFTASNGYDPGLIIAWFPYADPDCDYGNCFKWTRIQLIEDAWLWHKEDITRHEYGHNVMYNAQDGWWPPYPDNVETNPLLTTHPNYAWTEGWATAFTQFVDTDGFLDGYETPEDAVNMEDPTLDFPDLHTGHTNQFRVAASLSDLYDPNIDGDDYATIEYSDIIATLQDHSNYHLISFWNNLKPVLSCSDKHYASRALIYNTIVVDPESAPGPLDVSISGPSSLGYGESGSYTANIISGCSNYIHKWYKRYQGSGTWHYLGTGQTRSVTMYNKSFHLKVKVTGGGETDIAMKFVMYQGGGAGKIVAELIEELPESYDLKQNHPNPFNPTTTIQYQLPEESDFSLVIYDLLGKEVMKWIIENEQPGYKQVVWNGRDRYGNQLPAGIYIYYLKARSTETNKQFMKSRKMVLLK